jgi:type II secretory pathway pseudopilin PulG
MGAGLAAVGTFWSTTAQREREEELLFVGEQFREAIRSYHDNPTGGPKVFPKTLADLVEDNRGVKPARHLRKLFADPMTGSREWGLVRAGDRITGVHSLHTGVPMRRANFTALQEPFASAQSYRDWRFTYVAAAVPAAAAAAAPPTPTGPADPGVPSGPDRVIAIPDGGSVALPAPPPVKRRTEECELQRSEDLRACVQGRSAGTTATEISICTASATSRFFACTRGTPPPELRLPKR